MSWKNSVNKVSIPNPLSNINDFLTTKPNPNDSAIDDFYIDIDKYKSLLLSNNSHILNTHPYIKQILIIGFISCTENYFRDICTNIVNICPIAREKTSEKNIQFGSVLWHLNSNVTRGIFEGKSFADSKEIKKVFNEFLGIDLKTKLDLQLENFRKICQLRHSVVHSKNILAGKNAVNLQLNLNSCLDYKVFEPNIIQLLEIYTICVDLVSESNNILFENMCQRWATKWRSRDGWIASEENPLFRNIWKIFYSDIDNEKNLINNKLTIIKCKNKIKREYGLG